MKPVQTLVLITLEDGRVAVMTLILHDGRNSFPLDDARVDREIARDAGIKSMGSPVVTWRHTVPDNLPTDRYFRDAWRDGSGVVSIDMTAAREVHKDKLRAQRAPKMAELDVAYMRALETADAAGAAAIALQKQALRDCTDDPAIAAATTPDELKAVIPDALAD